MYDANILAILIPYDENSLATAAFRLGHNADRFMAAKGIASPPSIGSREPTPAPLSPSLDDVESHDRLVLRFDEPPKDPAQGWQFGTDKITSDILLGVRGAPAISRRQFTITVDERSRVWLTDPNSKFGTIVRYSRHDARTAGMNGPRLVAPDPGEVFPSVTIRLDRLKFEIRFPNHDYPSEQYKGNLAAFFRRCRCEPPLIDALGLASNWTTVAPTEPQTPKAVEDWILGPLIGRGESSEVYRATISISGLEGAAKKFLPFSLGPVQKNKRVSRSEKQWLDKIQGEVDIMLNHPHPNVMRVIAYATDPEPRLIMPYYSVGHLGNIDINAGDLGVSAFRQILLGVEHLHKHKVVHRDLKPENLLVDFDPFRVIIADFGNSKVREEASLTTFCGTRSYAAPEIFRGAAYGDSVDIWSSGVIMLESIFGLPDRSDLGDTGIDMSTWAQRLVERADDCNENDDKVASILVEMIVIDQGNRLTATQCLEAGV